MDASVTLTFLSAVRKFIRSGERAGQPFFRAHFLTAEEEPTSFSINEALFTSLKERCKFGDVIDACVSINVTPSGTYTQLVGFKE